VGPSASFHAPALLATKLYRPRQTHDVTVRPRLIERLDQGLAGPLTLISAPAGFGKTTLVAHRLAQLVLPSAWLALDAYDDAPETFVRYLVAALQGIDPAIGAQVVPLLERSDTLLPQALIGTLLNDLAALTHDSVLVLDDLHVLTHPAIYDALAYLLDHLSPRLHLVLLTREDPPLPLARLRARRQLVELRAADLRFTLAEADAFLHDAMHLSLDMDTTAALVGRTEGWIVGLQLAALSLRDLGAEDVAAAIDAFTSNNRYVVDYLVDEVIRAQPPHLQHFLLQTSLLDRLCAPLCDAILGLEARDLRLVGTDIQQASSLSPQVSQAYSQLILEALERANLFVVPLDSARHWYRYHHLFAEVLQTRLLSGAAAQQIRQLRQRASAWCEQEGLLAEAVQYALAARDWERAARLVEQATPAMIQRSELTQLLSWLDTLPAAEVQARPRLALYYGWVLFLSGQTMQLAARLSATEAMLEADAAKQTPELLGHIAAIRAYVARLGGDFGVAIALSRQALADLPEQDALLQAAVTFNLAIAHYLQGEFEPASQLLTQTIARGQTAQPIADPLSAIYLQAQLLRAKGALHQALQLCQEGPALVARRGWHNVPAVGFVYVAFGDLLRERNELTTAAEYLESGV
jgi:LuxR family maltose regulon positive regulatory protein